VRRATSNAGKKSETLKGVGVASAAASFLRLVVVTPSLVAHFKQKRHSTRMLAGQ
jgi:hypothetical protein